MSRLPHRAPVATHHPEPVLDVVVPVFNEERDLEPSVRRLHAHLCETFPYPFRITIADNASTDSTPRIAARLADELPEAQWFRLAEKGRGRALRTAWSLSTAPVLAYMDVDLSTELTALLPLVAPLLSGHSDIAIGTRLAPGSRVVRGPKREITSRCYNALLRSVLAVGFSDAQCGFKAVRRDVAERLLPLIQDSEWFFDTELLVIAERAGLRIHEVPVDWVDDPDTRVDILATALADLRGIARIGGALARGTLPPGGSLRDGGADASGRLATQLVCFAAVGAVSTLAYLLLYAALRPAAGSQAANALALLVCAVANTAMNRRLTFGLRGRGGVLRHQGRGLVVLLIGLALTGGSLATLHHAVPSAGQATELAVLLAANLAATLLRFLFFRVWVFRA
ncbi:bifunctional glycosyltransferase family 2/GtrA family protein [Streptomyces sp. NBC_00378]|uniref:glycosyltransferase n=1 Tax=unclassified Streptomyces TaxID=2593676 RepID=UPI00225B8241|nr:MULTISPECIES: glycosyltransferase [unclassified Streptomyces]MCX5112393.1 bifunctional glycosyltransferase family 2/GtrA family protein [Streptomyces sp. NBC_00378]